jgi:radical SAM protein with 4Fe4S-binding SPASM domain
MIQLQIETTSTCNAKCGFCPYVTAKRWGTLMPMGLFERIVTEAAAKPTVTVFALNGLGEPLLDPHLVERIRIARNLRPDWVIYFHTNGFTLTPATFHKLADAGLSHLSISLNAVSAAQHERAMGVKGKYDTVVKNIEYAIANKPNSMRIEVTAIADFKEFTFEHSKEFLKRWGNWQMDGHGKCVYIGNWSGDIESSRPFTPNECCVRATTQIYVMADGRVSTCCFDPTGKQIFGDLRTQSLSEIYSDPVYVQFREDHAYDRADKYEQCKGCTRI